MKSYFYRRPRIVVSACLGFKPVRYDGNIVHCDVVDVMKKYVDFIIFCPEVEAGLGVPRNPIVLVKDQDSIKLIDVKTSSNYYEKLYRVSKEFLESIKNIDGFLLKSSSPSCGVRDAKLYSSSRRVLSKVDGLFTKLARDYCPDIPIESEKRLLNDSIRRDYFTKIFSLADLRETIASARTLNEIVEFHRMYKYVLLLYSPTQLKKLGKLVAERHRYEFNDFISKYVQEFKLALNHIPRKNSYANVMRHIYSHFKTKLNELERTYLRSLIEDFEYGRKSFEVVISYLKGLVYRFEDSYLAEQRFLNPYPEELENIFTIHA